jgi:hypothetical protein
MRIRYTGNKVTTLQYSVSMAKQTFKHSKIMFIYTNFSFDFLGLDNVYF